MLPFVPKPNNGFHERWVHSDMGSWSYVQCIITLWHCILMVLLETECRSSATECSQYSTSCHYVSKVAILTPSGTKLDWDAVFCAPCSKDLPLHQTNRVKFPKECFLKNKNIKCFKNRSPTTFFEEPLTNHGNWTSNTPAWWPLLLQEGAPQRVLGTKHICTLLNNQSRWEMA